MSELTPWFVNGERPARPGVYNVSCRKLEQSGDWFARWDGEKWFMAYYEPGAAAHCMLPAASSGDYWSRKGSWRGLTQNPEASHE